MKNFEIGMTCNFSELWDGNYDGQELLESGTISPDEETVVEFKVIETADDPLDAVVEITDIF